MVSHDVSTQDNGHLFTCKDRGGWSTLPRGASKSIGVHMSLTAVSRAMPACAAHEVSAAGGRAGWFDPLRAGESGRVTMLLNVMVGECAPTFAHTRNKPPCCWCV